MGYIEQFFQTKATAKNKNNGKNHERDGAIIKCEKWYE